MFGNQSTWFESCVSVLELEVMAKDMRTAIVPKSSFILKPELLNFLFLSTLTEEKQKHTYH